VSQVPALGKPAAYGDFVLGRRLELIDEMGMFRGRRLLDVGCGNGAQTVRLLDRFRHVVGLDVVQEHLRVLNRALEESQIQNCDTVVYDGSRMPFRDADFDAVISIETLEHVADEQQLLGEIHRVLRPGGTLVLSVPNKWWIFETHGANLPLLPWNRVPFFSWLPRPIHSRFACARIYTRGQTARLLASAGFEILSTRYLTAPMDVVRNEALAGFLRSTVFRGAGTPVPFLSTSVFVLARRPQPETGGSR
jgi:ubiquinone/menaquinone biosynthesis C-methylase UbiE